MRIQTVLHSRMPKEQIFCTNDGDSSDMSMGYRDEEHRPWVEYDNGISSDLDLRTKRNRRNSRRRSKSNEKRMDARRASYKANPERKDK